MNKTLPLKPSIEYYKKQAKELLKAFKEGGLNACKQLKLIGRYVALNDEKLLKEPIKLADAQYAIALDNGYKSWKDFSDYCNRKSMSNKQDIKTQWAPRIKKELLKQLYIKDSTGIYDEDFANEIGHILCGRIKAKAQVNDASEKGEIICPACRNTFAHDKDDLQCNKCGWAGKWKEYRRLIKNKSLAPSGEIDIFMNNFVKNFPKAQSYQEKMTAIDQLIHTFGGQMTVWPIMPILKGLIRGNVKEVLTFLDELAYGKKSTPGLAETKKKYLKTLSRFWAGGAPRPKNWRDKIEDVEERG